jgi:hypothetical protein
MSRFLINDRFGLTEGTKLTVAQTEVVIDRQNRCACPDEHLILLMGAITAVPAR